MAVKSLLRALLTITTALVAFPALAANFTITSGTTATSEQDIGPGASETGLVEAGGAITTTDPVAINSTSAGGIVTNNGDITLNAGFSQGIFANALNNTVTNNGSITANALGSTGLNASANNAVMSNTGTITVNGNNSSAIYSASNNATFSNSGTLAVNNSNSSSNGVRLAANAETFTNTGTIATSGTNTRAVYALGTNATVTNNNLVTTSGTNAYGLYSDSASNSLVNNGTIITNGTNADAMLTDAANTIINNGTIRATGAATEGMNSTDGATLINNGYIYADSTGNGMRGFGSNITITNNGYVHSTNGITVEMTQNNNTLNLGTNSMVDGTVVYGGAGGILNYNITNPGRGGSVAAITGTITGAHTTNINATGLTHGAQVVQGGNIVAVVTPDNFSAGNQLITQTLTDTGNIVHRRQQLALLGDSMEIEGGTQYAAASINDSGTASGWGVRDRKVAWAEAFGSYQERGTNGDTSESSAATGGILAGVDLPQSDSGIRSGLYAGVFSGSLDIGETTFREIRSTGLLAGGYLGKSYNAYYISGQLAAGYSRNDSQRATGVDFAQADYDSLFLSPSVTVMRPIVGNGVTWVPSLMLRYTAQYDATYSETASVASQSVGARTSHLADARAILEAHLDEKRFLNGMFKPSLRAGIAGQTRIGNNDADVNVLGNAITLNPNGGDNYIDGIIGVNFTHAIDKGPQIYADAEANLGLNKGGPGDNKGLTARAGARWKF